LHETNNVKIYEHFQKNKLIPAHFFDEMHSLELAVKYDATHLVNHLIANGCAVNKKFFFWQYSPCLIQAMESGFIDILKSLITAGAMDGDAKKKAVKILHHYLKHALISEKDQKKLRSACYMLAVDAINKYLSEGDSESLKNAKMAVDRIAKNEDKISLCQLYRDNKVLILLGLDRAELNPSPTQPAPSLFMMGGDLEPPVKNTYSTLAIQTQLEQAPTKALTPHSQKSHEEKEYIVVERDHDDLNIYNNHDELDEKEILAKFKL
jgi:hypothetical protein